MNKIRVMLVDDHEIVRWGLTGLINDQEDMEVVAQAGNANEVLEAIDKNQPEVVLMDIRLPGQSGIEATRLIKQHFPDIRVIILTSYTDDQLVIQAIRAGAIGYVLKQVRNMDLLLAIRAAVRGETLLDPAIAARLLVHVRNLEEKLQENAFRDLSEREMDVLMEVTRGKTNLEIGQLLNLQEKTVRNYVSNILEKLHLNNRIELAVYSVQNGIFNREKTAKK